MSDSPIVDLSFLEGRLEEALASLTFQLIGHRPSSVQCRFVGSDIVILLNGIKTLPEQQLIWIGRESLAAEFRESLHAILRRQICCVVEAAAAVSVINVVTPRQLELNMLGFIVSTRPLETG